jgi:hypothetical protein
MQAVAAAGGKVLTPRMTVPGVGYMVYCLDSEGNSRCDGRRQAGKVKLRVAQCMLIMY